MESLQNKITHTHRDKKLIGFFLKIIYGDEIINKKIDIENNFDGFQKN
jgi:hypothetical protein